jgi:hypothetical protein
MFHGWRRIAPRGAGWGTGHPAECRGLNPMSSVPVGEDERKSSAPCPTPSPQTPELDSDVEWGPRPWRRDERWWAIKCPLWSCVRPCIRDIRGDRGRGGGGTGPQGRTHGRMIGRTNVRAMLLPSSLSPPTSPASTFSARMRVRRSNRPPREFRRAVVDETAPALAVRQPVFVDHVIGAGQGVGG